MYALLTGRPPFEAPTREELFEKIQEEDPKPVRKCQKSVPGPLEALVHQMLEKEPEDRCATAAALVEELDRVAKAVGL